MADATKTPYDEKKVSGAKARANDDTDGNSHVSKDVFTNPHKAFLANTYTVEDARGVERVVEPSMTPFTPAPVDPDEDAVKHMAALAKEFEKAKKVRLAGYQGEIKDEDRAKNVAGDGGSQSVPS